MLSIAAISDFWCPRWIPLILVDPVHLHFVPGADVAHLLLHEIVPNAQRSESKPQKDWKADHDPQIVDFHGFGQG
jgi:hypothetical protein